MITRQHDGGLCGGEMAVLGLKSTQSTSRPEYENGGGCATRRLTGSHRHDCEDDSLERTVMLGRDRARRKERRQKDNGTSQAFDGCESERWAWRAAHSWCRIWTRLRDWAEQSTRVQQLSGKVWAYRTEGSSWRLEEILRRDILSLKFQRKLETLVRHVLAQKLEWKAILSEGQGLRVECWIDCLETDDLCQWKEEKHRKVMFSHIQAYDESSVLQKPYRSVGWQWKATDDLFVNHVFPREACNCQVVLWVLKQVGYHIPTI